MDQDKGTEAARPGQGHDSRRYSVEPHRARSLISGHIYQLEFWHNEEWGSLPETERPGTAIRLGSAGWIYIRHAG